MKNNMHLSFVSSLIFEFATSIHPVKEPLHGKQPWHNLCIHYESTKQDVHQEPSCFDLKHAWIESISSKTTSRLPIMAILSLLVEPRRTSDRSGRFKKD